jgi:hypothetical protein
LNKINRIGDIKYHIQCSIFENQTIEYVCERERERERERVYYILNGACYLMSCNLWAVKKVIYLIISPPVSYNLGIWAWRIKNLGFNKKKGGKDKQHEC